MTSLLLKSRALWLAARFARAATARAVRIQLRKPDYVVRVGG